MIKKIFTVGVSYLLGITLLADLKAGIKDYTKLSINSYIILSDNQGVVIPKQVAILTPGDMVKFLRTDGTLYTGKITEVEETPNHIKIFGECDNFENVSFGFALVKGGVFAGAVVSKDGKDVYTLEFSNEHKGYVFLRTFKYNKTTI